MEIVENVTPAIRYDDDSFPVDISKSFVGIDTNQDVAIIKLDFTPDQYYEIAEHCESHYVVEEIRSRGESGRPLLDEDYKICGVLSRSKNGMSIYSGLII